MKRTTLWAALVLAAGLTLTACTTPLEKADTPAAPAVEQDAAQSESAAPAPAPEPEKPAEKAGTHANPFPKGTKVGTDKVDIALGEVTWNANDIVAAENQFNELPADGSTYALLPVTITNLTDPEAVNPSWAVTIKFVADDGRSFDQEFEVIPSPLSDVGDLYAGGVGTGNMLFLLPNDVSPGGQWAVSQAFGDPVFIAAH